MRKMTIVGAIAASWLLITAGPTPALAGGDGSGGGGDTKAKVLRVSASGNSCRKAKYTTIQAAVNAANDGDKIIVCSGIYDEQVTFNKRLTVRGKSGAIVRPSSMIANTTSQRNGDAIASVLTVTKETSVKRLEVDASNNGLGCTTDDPILVGVFFRGASGAFWKGQIHGTKLGTSDRDCESGAAVLVQGVGGEEMKVTIKNNTIFDYQRAGVVVNEEGAVATVRSNTITGLGSTSDVSQYGVQVGYGATAKVQKNVIADNATPTTASCVFDGGNLSFEANKGSIVRNTFSGNTAGVYISGDSNKVIKNIMNGISGTTAAGLDGVVIVGDNNTVKKNGIANMSATGVRVLGSGNKVQRNTIQGTHASTLCNGLASSVPDCADLLDTCGVGVWVMMGANNKVSKNTFIDNDTDMMDDGLATIVHRR